ncbi:glycine cleavage system protein GcvH [Oceanospirillum sp.]|uniref:glycine cleavage system protein GcvH n=1 Tax=Oceanospirillum sp. TaxID=2021254 RepID=UPI003A957544
MSNIPGNLKYTASHEWVLDNGDGTVTVGITDHAQDQLGDVVFVELPEVGREVDAGEEFSLVESVKAASDIYAPVTGEIVEVNEELEGAPETINEHAFEDGWIAKIKLADASDLEGLLDAEAYAERVAEDD